MASEVQDANDQQTVIRISTESDASEEVQFETVKRSTMSLAETWEQATGLKDDRKHKTIDRSGNILGISPNSLENKAFINDGIKVVEDELNSAYVELNFKPGQFEKLIELTIINNNKYYGERQVGFNLSSIDGSQIAGMYSSLTLIIKDDEKEVPSYINFTNETYYPKDGYITVDIERSGNLSSLATCMIDSEDITAKEHQNYSKVHAELIFGMGINKRTVKIPIVTIGIKNEARFKLKLQEAKGALIGDNAESICIIRHNDENFKIVEDKLFGSSQSSGSKPTTLVDSDINYTLDNGVIVDVHKNKDKLYGAGGDPETLSSIKPANNPIKFKDGFYSFTSENANSNSYHNFINEDKGIELYIENHDFGGETASMRFGVKVDGYTKHYDYEGFRLNWACDGPNAHIVFTHCDEDTSTDVWKTLYNKNRETWAETTNDYFIDSIASRFLWFKVYRYDGWWRESPKITINSITPILRKFKIRLKAAEIPELINEYGEKTVDHKYAAYATTEFDNHLDDQTVLGWSGKSITVKFDNSINNPFYIKELRVVKGNDYCVIARYDDVEDEEKSGNKSGEVSFQITNDMLESAINLIDFHPREGGGKTGEFTIQPVLGTRETVIKVEKDNRVNVKIWNDQPSSSDTQYDIYKYTMGDVVHFTTEMNSVASELYECNGLYRDVKHPTKIPPVTLRRESNDNYFSLDSSLYKEVVIVPEVSQKNNSIIVKVSKSAYDKFDKAYGLFNGVEPVDSGKYYDYGITVESDKICGNNFEMRARCTDKAYSPVWYIKNKEDVKYMQDAYYHRGAGQAEDNVIYLTAEKADSKEYSLVGTAYYEEVPLGGKIVDRSWQVAKNIGIIVDETHFAYSDDKGEFAVIPGKGKDGYYKKYKVVCNGEEQYNTIQLNNDNLVTKEYKVEYADGIKTFKSESYQVTINELAIGNIDTTHPHVLTVKSLNRFGTSFNAVYINDDVSILKAKVRRKNPNGDFYKYTYTDERGISHTEDEDIKRVEFVVIDFQDNSVKTVIEATMSNADKTEWTAFYSFERGHYNEYKSGDRLYVRVVTNRKVGDGKGYDIGSGSRKEVPIFNETTYASINTSFHFREEAEKQPYIVDFKFPADKAGSYSLPLIGSLSTMINALGMSFGVRSEAGRIRLFIGKKFNGAGNRYDNNGKTVSDSGYKIGFSNFKEGLSDMKDFVNSMGSKKLGKMSLGIPTWTFEPIIGVYFEFMLYHDPNAVTTETFEFTGGGGYIGAILDLRYTLYFLVYGVPCYVGGEVNLQIVGEFGVAVDAGEHIALNDPSQAFFDELFKKTHFEFVFRATMVTSAYVGVGLAGTVGVRGGFELTLHFIYNPFATKRYKEVTHPVGFSVTGAIKIWIDAILLSIPVPLYTFVKPKNFGYFADLEDYEKEHGGKPLFGASDEDSFKNAELTPRPRMEEESEFVYTSSFDKLFGATYRENVTKTIINNAYDDAQPQIMDLGNDKFLLVYLDDDHSRNKLERTVLKWTVYNGATDTWTTPRDVHEDNNSADFNPTLCHCDDKILVAWSSRPNSLDEDVPKKELLQNMEIYARFFDIATMTFGEVERITNDDAYDYYPKAIFDSTKRSIYLYYLKKSEIGDINTSEDLLNAIQPEVNGSFLMYMLYEDPRNYDISTTSEARWVRDYYYDSEIGGNMAEQLQGQRFAKTSIIDDGEEINNPNISDYAVGTIETINITPEQLDWVFQIITGGITVEEFENFTDEEADAFWEEYGHAIAATLFFDYIQTYDVKVLQVDEDGDPNTKDDTEMYLKLYNVDDNALIKTIRLTNNNTSDMMPKIVKTYDDTYVFWIQNESMIKMLNISQIVAKAGKEDHSAYGLVTGKANIMTTDKIVLSDKLNNYYPFADNQGNVFLVWQQQTKPDLKEEQSGEISFKQDIYMAGLVRSTDSNASEVYSWSNLVQLTNNEKLNSLPTMTNFVDGRLMFVNNQYNLNSKGDGYTVSDSKLQEIIFTPASSLEIDGIITDLDTTNSDGSSRYKVGIRLINNGVTSANGFTYTGSIKYDGTQLVNINGSSNEIVIPGENVVIGEDISNKGLTDTDSPIYVTLTKAQMHHLDKLKINLKVKENNVSDDGKTFEANLMPIEEDFTFVMPEEGNEHVSPGELQVIQDGDDFVVTGTLINTGNIDSTGNEKIYVSVNGKNYAKPVASSSYIDLEIDKQTSFSIKVDGSEFADVSIGYEDFVVWVMNDEKERLSDYEMVTAFAKKPFKFAVNNQTEVLTIKEGETINLNALYEPSKRYKNATVLYSTDDRQVANVAGNVITGLSAGTTVLNLSTKEFGGADSIVIKVEEKNKKPDYNGSSGGSGGGGGGGGYISSIPLENKNSLDEGRVTELSSVPAGKVLTGAENISWTYLPTTNDWQLSYVENGETKLASNVFIDVPRNIAFGVETQIPIYDRYYFDSKGKMLVGWLHSPFDDKWYYFEANNNTTRGHMIMGSWKQIQGKWYYFGIDGVMYRNQFTPDGYLVDQNGEWVK